MKFTHLTLGLSLLFAGVSIAGPVPYDKVVVPEPVCGPFYVSAYGGGSFFDDDVDFTENALFDPSPDRIRADFDDGYILGAAVGVRTDTNWRMEVDLNFQNRPGESEQFAAGGGSFLSESPLYGDVDTTSAFFNVVKEFGMNRWRPYAGAGVGLSNVELSLSDVPGAHVGSGNEFKSEEVVLAYQFLGGVVFDVTDCFQTYLEYRLSGHGDLEDVADGDDLSNFTGPLESVDLGWSQHIILGARFYF